MSTTLLEEVSWLPLLAHPLWDHQPAHRCKARDTDGCGKMKKPNGWPAAEYRPAFSSKLSDSLVICLLFTSVLPLFPLILIFFCKHVLKAKGIWSQNGFLFWFLRSASNLYHLRTSEAAILTITRWLQLPKLSVSSV